MILSSKEMTPCCICLEEFPDWKVNNPRYCCSAKLCQFCAQATRSCPQCRHQDPSLRSDSELVHLQTATFKCYTREGLLCLEWSRNNVLNRTDGPAKVCYYESGRSQTETYHKDGKLDRTDGPAEICYYESGQSQTESYYIDNKLHRIDGPAIIYYHQTGQIGSVCYFKDGKRM